MTRSGIGLVARAEDEGAIEEALVAVASQSGPSATVPRELYDGAIRAAELEQILLAVTNTRAWPLASDTPPAA